MSTPKSALTAKWPTGRKVAPGLDARDFLAAEVARCGEDPEAVRRAIVKDTPLARMLLARLGLTRESLAGPGRPRDVPRAVLIVAVVDALREDPHRLSLAEACREAPRYLANPKLRMRAKVAQHLAGAARGRDRRVEDMTPGAVADAYRAARSDLPHLWFDPIEDNAVPEPSRGSTAG